MTKKKKITQEELDRELYKILANGEIDPDSMRYVIQLCEDCLQMTNHIKGVCQKCKIKKCYESDCNLHGMGEAKPDPRPWEEKFDINFDNGNEFVELYTKGEIKRSLEDLKSFIRDVEREAEANGFSKGVIAGKKGYEEMLKVSLNCQLDEIIKKLPKTDGRYHSDCCSDYRKETIEMLESLKSK